MEIRFDEYNAYPDSDIVEVTSGGIRLSTGQYLDFSECAANFQSVHGGSGKCVGERDSSDCSITFYTAPLTTCIRFVGRRWFRPSPMERFRRLLGRLSELGYTTYNAG